MEDLSLMPMGRFANRPYWVPAFAGTTQVSATHSEGNGSPRKQCHEGLD